MGGASRQRRCRAQRAKYATHDSEWPMGRVLGIPTPPGKACSRSAATTGDFVQLRRLQPAVAMAEARACRRDADEVTEIELMAHTRQHLEWQVQQGGRARQGQSHGAIYRRGVEPIHMNILKQNAALERDEQIITSHYTTHLAAGLLLLPAASTGRQMAGGQPASQPTSQ
jgi:hypothetical protein